MPAEDAVKYMKDAAEHSYAKKGMDVVEKNWNAIEGRLSPIAASWSRSGPKT